MRRFGIVWFIFAHQKNMLLFFFSSERAEKHTHHQRCILIGHLFKKNFLIIGVKINMATIFFLSSRNRNEIGSLFTEITWYFYNKKHSEIKCKKKPQQKTKIVLFFFPAAVLFYYLVTLKAVFSKPISNSWYKTSCITCVLWLSVNQCHWCHLVSSTQALSVVLSPWLVPLCIFLCLCNFNCSNILFLFIFCHLTTHLDNHSVMEDARLN